uniref:NADH-ubiquinone oxidoreductase chain 5 n=1 Tax=Ornithodoros turicata TaxID=34597 RepID=A0A3G2KJY6_9ACAR|nr:NADH dehydrogenase subunit 5 [Ornithodoros turicata]
MFLKWGIYMFILSFLFMFLGLFFMLSMSVLVIEYFLLVMGDFELKFYLLFDWMSMMFVCVVLFISCMVIFYSNDYMESEKFKVYFCYGVLLFVGSMLMMIMSPNLLMILLGWDGLGLVSYCLVIFYQNFKSDSAGMITVMSNRIGDVMILLSFVFLINFGNLDFLVFSKMFLLGGFMLIVAGMTKSAQIPFSAWLPAAMAAPTPVSSLVHSSTLVTAGVYILIRLDMLFYMDGFRWFLACLALLTMVMSGIGAVLEMDLKKIVALSTLSQLGLMMLILSLGETDLAFFHLLTHALFKAMLFLCAGFMIHSSLGGQDIRFMGFFFCSNPLIGVAFSLANLSLFGLPFLSGFYSKDMVLEFIYANNENWFIIFLVVLATVMTCVYSLRVMYYSMWKGSSKLISFSNHWSFCMEIPVVFMGLLVIFFGSMMSWIMFSHWSMSIIMLKIKLINVMILLLGCWSFYSFYSGFIGITNLKKINDFFGSMWFLSISSGSLSVKSLISGLYYFKFDNGWLEEVGPQGVYKINCTAGVFVQWFQISNLKNIIILMFFVVLLFF